MKRPAYFPTHTKGGAKGLDAGFSSGLERATAQQLVAAGIPFEYEAYTIRYVKPSKSHTYTPDLVLSNGIVIECKGLWETADRGKHVILRTDYPDLDIRFIFSNEHTKIGKKSPTSYGDYCRRLGIPYATRTIPAEWLVMDKKLAKLRFEALLAACQPLT